MPSTGTSISKISRGVCGPRSAYTDSGPPDRIIPFGAKLGSPSQTIAGENLGIDAELAYAPCDELGVLGAEIED